MTDTHVHIGQFKETYYSAEAVFAAIVHEGSVDSVVFSSTTSCRDGISYREVERELDAALASASACGIKAKPFFWYVPDYAAQGVRVEKVMSGFPYTGIKIHPRAHCWDLTQNKTVSLVHELFAYADEKHLPVLIHTGVDEAEAPGKFSAFFGAYPDARFILAHGRPVEQTLELLRRFSHCYCDTAFMPEDALQRIIGEGLGNKVLLGTDFPITAYFTNTPLEEQYRVDAAQMRFQETLLGNTPRSG
jgi:predicted TIM-barrel fold metal-dependent hydrolase